MKKLFAIFAFILLILPKLAHAIPVHTDEGEELATMYCVYDGWLDVQLIFNSKQSENNKIIIANYDPGKYKQFDKNCPFCSEDWFIAGNPPKYNFAGVWEQSVIPYSVNYTSKYNQETSSFSSCPEYVAEVLIEDDDWYTNELPILPIAAEKYVFYDNEDVIKKLKDDGNIKKYRSCKLVEQQYVYEKNGNIQTPGNNSSGPGPVQILPTYTITGNKDACERASNGSWKKTCSYSGPIKGSDEAAGISHEFKLYLSDNNMLMVTESKNDQSLNILLKFSRQDIGNDCPKQLYYTPNATGTHYIVGLKEFANEIGNMNNYELQSRKMTFVSEKNGIDILSVCLQYGMPDISLTPDSLDCVGILGRPDDDISKPPAFYLQTAFTVMKYVAIVILIVFTIMDYTGAVSSQDNDAIKKAASKLVTRLIICVILFVLPTLIEFLFKILDIYGDAAHCKIN